MTKHDSSKFHRWNTFILDRTPNSCSSAIVKNAKSSPSPAPRLKQSNVKKDYYENNKLNLEHKKCADHSIVDRFRNRFLPTTATLDDNFSLGYNIFVSRNVVNSSNNLGKKVVVLVMFCFYGANEQSGLDRYLSIQAFNPCYVEAGNYSHGIRSCLLTTCNIQIND